MIVTLWTGREASYLRRALRMTIVEFAEVLGVSTRTVDNWEARGPKIEPRPEIQRALDTLLARADPGAQLRLSALLSPLSRVDAHVEPDVQRLGSVPVEDVLRWLVRPNTGAVRDRPTGRSVVGEDVAEVVAAVRHFEDLDHRFGGGFVQTAAAEYLAVRVKPLVTVARLGTVGAALL